MEKCFGSLIKVLNGKGAEAVAFAVTLRKLLIKERDKFQNIFLVGAAN